MQRDPTNHALSWVEISEGALAHNIGEFRRHIGADRALLCVVKANAYGHGLREVAPIAVRAGAGWLGVFSVDEARGLRDLGIDAPLLILGPQLPGQWSQAAALDARVTVPSAQAAADLVASGAARGLRVHLKVETGTHRQGVEPDEVVAVAQALQAAGAEIEGLYTHFADIEDTTDHRFASEQKRIFADALAALRDAGIRVPLPHTACTAAAMVFADTWHAMVRLGIGMYGLWPSKETRVSADAAGVFRAALRPVMRWKTRIAQVKSVPAGGFVGYGRTFRATRDSRIAVLPVGYADGYGRALSNRAHTLVRGRRAPVVGRVCMNLTMVDVTDIPGAACGDAVTLLGCDGDECVTADMLAGWMDTIHYEVVTRAAPGAPRLVVP